MTAFTVDQRWDRTETWLAQHADEERDQYACVLAVRAAAGPEWQYGITWNPEGDGDEPAASALLLPVLGDLQPAGHPVTSVRDVDFDLGGLVGRKPPNSVCVPRRWRSRPGRRWRPAATPTLRSRRPWGGSAGTSRLAIRPTGPSTCG
ncbi:hypothetical protein AB0N09_27000 [Streptomyces erythrochromogenes]|uniref:hypothetical protein n=1 Tax=Streptomyces erythrochromogenes TaxID=285574 RepID=UPI00341946D5